jgi:hypothetical protein
MKGMTSPTRRDAGSCGRDVGLYAKAEQLLRGSPSCSGQQGLEVLVSAAEAAIKVSNSTSSTGYPCTVILSLRTACHVRSSNALAV